MVADLVLDGGTLEAKADPDTPALKITANNKPVALEDSLPMRSDRSNILIASLKLDSAFDCLSTRLSYQPMCHSSK